MNNTPSYIVTRLADLNRKVGIFAEVEWTDCGFDWNSDTDWDTERKGPAPARIDGACYIVTNCVTGLPYAAVRTMSEAFSCAWALFKAYRNLERRGF
jgi:hypothetical protein